MTTRDSRKEWQRGLARAQAKDWKVLLWASDAYTQMGLAYQEGKADAKAEAAPLLEAAKRAQNKLHELECVKLGLQNLHCTACGMLKSAIAAYQGKE